MARSSFTRLVAVGAVGLVTIALAACGQAPETGGGNGGTGGSASPGAEDFTACMISDEGGFDDKSFNQLAHDGLDKAESELGIKTLEAESKTPDDYAPNLQAMVDSGCNIIVPVGFKLADATTESATANPETSYAIVDFDAIDLPNVLGLNYDTAQAAFMAGYAAAGYSKSGTVATYGGMSIPTVTIFMDGFVKGVEYHNEKKGTAVKVLGWDPASGTGEFVSNFTDQVRAQQITEGFLSQGADVILPVGGPLYQGGAEAVRAAGNSAVILGVDSDLAQADPQYADIILVSIMKGLDVTVFDAIQQSVEGTFKGGTFTGTLENDGVGLSGFGGFESQLPAGMTDELEQIKADIIAGTITDISPSSPKK